MTLADFGLLLLSKGFIVAAVVATGLIGLYAMPVGRLLKVIDLPEPDGRKRHAKPTPLVGGLAIMVPTLLVTTFLYFATGVAPYGALTLLCAGMFALGLFDDRSHIAAVYRLGISTLLCGGVIFFFPDLVLSRLNFSFLETSLPLGVAGVLLTTLCIVGLQNAVNMADGRNGLVIGMALIWTSLIAAYAPPILLPGLVVFGVALLISFAFNWRGHLFLGDAGAYSVSAMVSGMAIFTYTASTELKADVVILWFMVPVLDCVRLIYSRYRLGHSPFKPGRDHLHHYLSESVNWRFGLIIYLSIVAVPALVVLRYPKLTLLMMVVSATLYFGGLLLSKRRSEKKQSLAEVYELKESKSQKGQTIPPAEGEVMSEPMDTSNTSSEKQATG